MIFIHNDKETDYSILKDKNENKNQIDTKENKFINNSNSNQSNRSTNLSTKDSSKVTSNDILNKKHIVDLKNKK